MENIPTANIGRVAAGYQLAELPVPRWGRGGRPERDIRVIAAWTKAGDDFRARLWATAAQGFLRAAKEARAGADDRHSDHFRSVREAAYRNAATAYLAGGLAGAGRATLDELIAEDPESRDVLRASIARLSR